MKIEFLILLVIACVIIPLCLIPNICSQQQSSQYGFLHPLKKSLLDCGPYINNCGSPFHIELYVPNNPQSIINGQLGFYPVLGKPSFINTNNPNSTITVPLLLFNTDFSMRVLCTNNPSLYVSTYFNTSVLLIAENGHCPAELFLNNAKYWNVTGLMVYEPSITASAYSAGPGPRNINYNNFGSYETNFITPIPYLQTYYEDIIILKQNIQIEDFPSIWVKIKPAGDLSPQDKVILRNLLSSYESSEANINFTVNNVCTSTDLTSSPAFPLLLLWCEFGKIVLFEMAWSFYKFNGKLDLLSNFPHIRFLYLAWVRSSALCELHELQYVDMSLTLPDTANAPLPDCFDEINMPNLSFVRLDGVCTPNIAVNNSNCLFPRSILNNRNLQWFSATQNGFLDSFTSLYEFSLNHLDSLNYFDISLNSMTLPLQEVNNNPRFEYLDLSYNTLLGEMKLTSYDHLPALRYIKISHCSLYGQLPSLLEVILITFLDFSFNNLQGITPQNWLNFNTLNSVKLNNNYFTTSPNIYFMPHTAYLDISHNNLTILPGLYNDPCQLINLVILSPPITYVDFSYNSLTGDCSSQLFIENPSLQTVYVSHNKITGLPPDIFQDPNLVNVDFSYNNLTKYSLFPVIASESTFPPKLLYFDLSGNYEYSNLAAYKTALNTWLFKTSGSTVINNEYTCPSFGLKLNPSTKVQIEFDPAFYEYSECVCLPGLFGIVPYCHYIPSNTSYIQEENLDEILPIPVLNPFLALSSNYTGNQFHPLFQAFTDGWYGNNRLIEGIDTDWIINGNNVNIIDNKGNDSITYQRRANSIGCATTSDNNCNNPDLSHPVVSIILYIHFDLLVFNSSSDVLVVYSDLGTTLFQQYTGTDYSVLLPAAKHANYPSYTQTDEYLQLYSSHIANFSYQAIIELQIPSNTIDINFRSRKPSGTHFFVTYQYMTTCPNNYHIETVMGSDDSNYSICSPDPYYLASGPLLGLVLMNGLCTILILSTLFIFLGLRNLTIIKASTPILTNSLLISIGFLCATGILYIVPPYSSSGTAYICSARVWCSCLGLVMIIAILVSKTAKNNKIYASTNIRPVQTNPIVMRWTISLVSIQIILLIIQDSYSLIQPNQVLINGEYPFWICKGSDEFYVWIVFELTYLGFLMLIAFIIAFRGRSLPALFNESHLIAASLLFLLFCLIILVPLAFIVSSASSITSNPDAAHLLLSAAQLSLAFFLYLINFLPRVYYIYEAVGTSSSIPNIPSSFPMSSVHT